MEQVELLGTLSLTASTIAAVISFALIAAIRFGPQIRAHYLLFKLKRAAERIVALTAQGNRSGAATLLNEFRQNVRIVRRLLESGKISQHISSILTELVKNVSNLH
jgi:hypothetical protein